MSKALTEQAAQQEAQIVRWNCPCGNTYTFHGFTKAPPQRTWVGLTEDERETIRDSWRINLHDQVFFEIEAKLKEKNT